jgi:hypothetical protein
VTGRPINVREPDVNKVGRTAGIVITGVMFIFSAYMYQRSGDWVAAVFAAGSLGYGLFFWLQGRGDNT